MTDAGRDRIVRTVGLEENVLDAVANNLRTIIRTVAQEFRIRASTMWRVLREQLIHPFRFQKVQNMNRNGFDQRVQFYRWFLNSTQQNERFLKLILFIDEASFTREGMFNTHARVG
jgi:hypothetical protein